MKGLKSTRPAPAISPDEMLRAAGEAAPQQPPAIVQRQGDDRPAVLSVLLDRADLTSEQAAWAMDSIMSGTATSAQLAGFAIALRAIRLGVERKQDTDEMAGLVVGFAVAAGEVLEEQPCSSEPT